MTFADDQLKAARSFAYTMIVVDDEPVFVEPEDIKPPTKTKTPSRRDVAAVQKDEETPEANRTHRLDTKGLIKSALDLGLVCSVVNPSGDEDNVAKSITKASIRADIVSLDWHMNDGDDGELASKIIEEILCEDEEIGGRLRLIAIYTGNKECVKIIYQIADRLNKAENLHDKVTNHGSYLTNSTGLRLIWRQKSMGNDKLPDAVSVDQLPQELLAEFAKLSKGLLTNVALATIASMRDATHHVLNKFSSELDGPFFHHRANIKNSSDSMNYAVSVVMSALKSEVDKSKITSHYTTVEAIKRRLNDMPQGPENFTLRYQHKKNGPKEFKLNTDDILHVMEGKVSEWPDQVLKDAGARQEDQEDSPIPPKNAFKSNFSSLFYNSVEKASLAMHQFAFLTTSQSSELSKIHQKTSPRLGLGSIIHSEEHGYLLCLQATCDAVRGDGSFFFVPLEAPHDNKPQVVFPHREADNETHYVGLSVPGKCYTQSLNLKFGGVDDDLGYIPVQYDAEREIYHVLDASGSDYRWLANLKHKRALRIAQDMSQEISRIGFDEFEPFRKN